MRRRSVIPTALTLCCRSHPGGRGPDGARVSAVRADSSPSAHYRVSVVFHRSHVGRLTARLHPSKILQCMSIVWIDNIDIILLRGSEASSADEQTT